MKNCVLACFILQSAIAWSPRHSLAVDPVIEPSQTVAPATSSANEFLSPVVRQALADLSSEKFKTREAALLKLQLAFAEQINALAAADDPEAQSRLVMLFQSQEALSRFALETFKLPPEERKAQLKFGLNPQIVPMIAQLFSSESPKRVDGIKSFARNNSEEATAMIGRLLDDADHDVFMAAVDVLRDRKPTEAIITSLWARAIGLDAAASAENKAEEHRRMQLEMIMAPETTKRRIDGISAATKLLVHFKSPLVAARLDAFLDSHRDLPLAEMYSLNAKYNYENLFPLIETYKPKEALSMFHKWANAPSRSGGGGSVNGNSFYYSSRTLPMISIIRLTKQKPEDYKFKTAPNIMLTGMTGEIWSTSSEKEELESLEKLNDWLAEHGEKFGLKNLPPRKKPAAPAPENQAAVKIAPGMNGMGGGNAGGAVAVPAEK